MGTAFDCPLWGLALRKDDSIDGCSNLDSRDGGNGQFDAS